MQLDFTFWVELDLSSKQLEFRWVHTVHQVQTGILFQQLVIPLSSSALFQHLKRSVVVPGPTHWTPQDSRKVSKMFCSRVLQDQTTDALLLTSTSLGRQHRVGIQRSTAGLSDKPHYFCFPFTYSVFLLQITNWIFTRCLCVADLLVERCVSGFGAIASLIISFYCLRYSSCYSMLY